MGKATAKRFKEEFTLEQRVQESRDMIAKHPDRVPVVAERYKKSDLPDLDKKKFLVPRDMPVGQFIRTLSGRLGVDPGKAMFVFVGNTLPQISSTIESVYNSYKEEDGFLYMCYGTENTFGSL
ncbi:autophagy 8 [Genlisea aurea]|uniref:Autophagy-related protein n=1 Tax=Genlisea aurea TaxID=192259 RepID=S8CML9_9LAMI|nr:autophagy 8 [Genlisea aurea]